MGWFETEDFPGALLGDEPLDLTGRFLEDLRAAYLDGPGRLPTVAELEATLAMVLGNVGARWFEELDGRRVVKIAIQAKPAPKRQSFAVGDVFAIPLAAGDFAFGRYIYEKPKEGGLIEIYGEVREAPVIDPQVLESKPLGHPLWVSGPALFEGGAFPILRKGPEFEAEGLDELELLGGPPHDYKIIRLDGTVVRKFDPNQHDWDEWKDRTLALRHADSVRTIVERWLGRDGKSTAKKKQAKKKQARRRS